MRRKVKNSKQLSLPVFKGTLIFLLSFFLIGGILACSVGKTYARYSAVGEVSLQFHLVSKPTLVVERTEDGFLVQSPGELKNVGIRIRVYGGGEMPRSSSSKISMNNVEYTLTVQELSPNRTAGLGMDVDWVYTFSDDEGEEILFDATNEDLVFVGTEMDFSNGRIVAEAVKK